MEIISQYARKSFDENGNVEVTFLAKGYASKVGIQNLEKDVVYKMKLTPVKSKRTLKQNAYMWELIEHIADKTGEYAWDIYLTLLERANVKYTYVAVLKEATDEYVKEIRHYKIMNSFEHKGKTFNQIKVYLGTSKFDTKEMSIQLEETIKLANELGIDTEAYYEQVLNSYK